MSEASADMIGGDCPTALLVDFSDDVPPQTQNQVENVTDDFGLLEIGPSRPSQLISQSISEPLIPPPQKLIDANDISAPAPILSPIDLDSSSASSTLSPFGLGLGLGAKKGSKRGAKGTPVSRIKSEEIKRPVDPFSPVFNSKTPVDPFSPVPLSVASALVTSDSPPVAPLVQIEDIVETEPPNSTSTPKHDGQEDENEVVQVITIQDKSVNLSDSDSLLDIDNLDLGSFSISDSDGVVLEQFLKKIKEEDLGKALKMKGEKLEAKMSQEEMVQRYLAVSEDDTPSSQTGSGDLADKKRRESMSTKLQRLSVLISSPIQSPATSPDAGSGNNYFPTPATTKAQSNSALRSQPRPFQRRRPSISAGTMTSPCKTDLSSVPEAKTEIIPPSPASSCNKYFTLPTPIRGSKTKNQDDTSKRLSFGSTTGSESSMSPTKSVKSEKLFSISKPVAAVRGAPQLRHQPLKVVPMSAPPVSDSTSSTKSTFSYSPAAEKQRSGSCSAPVTRKFLPPVAASSPLQRNTGHPSSRSSIGHLGTPGRKKEVARSSGYGQRSMNTSISAVTTPSKTIKAQSLCPTRPMSASTTTSCKQSASQISPNKSRPAMGEQGQILNSSLTITDGMKNAIQRPASVPAKTTATAQTSAKPAKENRPKVLASALPRPGFGFSFKKK